MTRGSRWVALIILAAAQLMLIVDVVVVNVALPSIAADLNLGEAELPFVGIAYTLVFGSLLIIGGRAGDLFGRRRVLRTGTVIFLFASLLAAFANEAALLIGARALQGLGAAFISPNAFASLLATNPEGDFRNRALGFWAATISVGAVLGQVVGGVIISTVGWPWIFLINVPVAGVFLLASGVLPADRETGADRRIDGLGAAMLAASLAALSVGLAILPRGSSVAGVGWLVAAVVVGAGFIAVERRQPNPVVRLSLLGQSEVRVGNVFLLIQAGSTAGALFFATLYLQRQLGYSPLAVGAGFAPITLIVVVVSSFVGRLMTRFGSRPLLVVGGLCLALGLAILARLPADGSYLTDILPGLVLVAVGNGLAYAPVLATATSGVPPSEQGLASGLVNTSQELGAALGLASLAAVAAVSGAAILGGYRWAYLVSAAAVLVAVALASRLPSAQRTAAAVVPEPRSASTE